MQFPVDSLVKFAKKNGHLPIIFHMRRNHILYLQNYEINNVVDVFQYSFSRKNSKQVIPYSVSSKFLVPTMWMYFNIHLVTKFVVFIQSYDGKLIKLLYAVYASMLH